MDISDFVVGRWNRCESENKVVLFATTLSWLLEQSQI